MVRRTNTFCSFASATACVLLFAFSMSSQAASVRAVGTNDLSARSDFVFHGKALEKWVTAGQRPGSIITNMRFSVFDVLKGDATRKTVVLSFLGGTLNGRTLRVEGMRLPAVGEEGVFFVERLDSDLVQPFYGWDQGRFLVRADGRGRRIVLTHDQQPIRHVDAVTASTVIATGHAGGVQIADSEREAMTVEAFKSRIRAILAAQATLEAKQ